MTVFTILPDYFNFFNSFGKNSRNALLYNYVSYLLVFLLGFINRTLYPRARQTT